MTLLRIDSIKACFHVFG